MGAFRGARRASDAFGKVSEAAGADSENEKVSEAAGKASEKAETAL